MHKCRICGEPELAHYYHREELKEQSLCFNCHFWQEKIAWRKSGREDCFVIEGSHYKGKDGDAGGRWAGFGGQEFFIETFDGRRIRTCNLWHQGDVPKHFRDVLCDNARFVGAGEKDA